MQYDVIYKALTREPLVFGIPLIPFLLVCMLLLFAGLLVSFAFWFLLPLAIYLMARVAKHDEAFFSLFVKKFFTTGDGRLNRLAGGYTTFVGNDFIDFRGDNDLAVIKNQGKNSFIGHHIPYEFAIGNVVVTKNYDFCMTWEMAGIPFELEAPEMIELAKNSLNMFFRQYTQGNISFYCHNIRVDANEKLNGKFSNEYAREINDRYFNHMTGLKENIYYMTVVYSPFNSVTLSQFRKKKEYEQREAFNEFLVKCDDISMNFDRLMRKYDVSRLGRYENEFGHVCNSQLDFFSYLIACKPGQVVEPDGPFYRFLNGGIDQIKFGDGVGEILYLDGSKKYFQTIEIKDYNNATYAGIFDSLLFVDANYIITSAFVPQDNKKTLRDIELQQKRLKMQRDKGESQIADLDAAQDQVVSGDLVFGTFSFSLTVYGDDIKTLNAQLNDVIDNLSTQGFLLSKTNLAAASTYFSQLPGNFKYRTRAKLLSSLNYADMISLHTFNKGKKDGNQWGEALTMFKTRSGQPYFFNFHETPKNTNDFKSDKFLLGNTLVIGKSGGGKTVLMNFLLSQLLKYTDKDSFAPGVPEDKKKGMFFYLDKDKGAIGNIYACGGKYLTIERGLPTGFNPFMVDNTEENIRKLQSLITSLVTRNGELLSSREQEMVNVGIKSVMDNFSKEDRKYGISLLLEHLVEDINEANSVKSRLRLWQKGNKFGWIFDNEFDELKFNDDSISIYGIDGTELLKDNEINDVVAYYILWRLMDLTDGRRFVLFIDEGWDWIRNKTVADEVFNKEKTIRKQNGLIVIGTQSVEDLAKSNIKTALIEQSSTIILLSNPQAKRVDYVDGLNMTNEDYEFVKNIDPNLYCFMVRKNDGERTEVILDLSSVGRQNLAILSTGSAFVDQIMDGVINKKDLTYEEGLAKLKAMYR